jgi:hypothetical protein
MSDDTAPRPPAARRELTLNFGECRTLTVAMPDLNWDDAAFWAGDYGDGTPAFGLDGWETYELFRFLAAIVDELRMGGRL